MELMEPVSVVAALLNEPEFLMVAIKEIKFNSAIKLFIVEAGGTETETPPAGTPHWGSGTTYPAVYVREGGAGELKALQVKVEWRQVGCSGSAKLKGRSPTDKIVIEGSFNISGNQGTADVSCEFTKRPNVVANYGRGVSLTWTVECAGRTATATGGNTVALYFVDAKPKPISWSYKAHYLKVVDWATSWAAGVQGKAKVLAAVWDQFSTGSAARVPHVTGFSYWKTGAPVQDLTTLLQPDGGAKEKGWSCRAIAHLFMECLALHGIQCLEVIPENGPATKMFLVHNWSIEPKPVPNWESKPGYYFAGSWVDSAKPPLATAVPTSLKRLSNAGVTKHALRIDMAKRPGVPAQGQLRAPLGFQNHWIVQVDNALYDTSYGLRHQNDMTAYAATSLAGWLIGYLNDSYMSGMGSLAKKKSSLAWVSERISSHSLVRNDGSSN